MSKWLNIDLSPRPEAYANVFVGRVDEAIQFIELIGWTCWLVLDEKLKSKWIISSFGEHLVVDSMEDLVWFSNNLLDCIRLNKRRWCVVAEYFRSDDAEKTAILDWLKSQGRSDWGEKCRRLCLEAGLSDVPDALKCTKEEILYPGAKFAGLTLLEDRPGGEHIQVANDHYFYGYIEREILREEWRRLSEHIPDAQAVRTGRDRL